MLPLKFETFAPYLKTKTRFFLLDAMNNRSGEDSWMSMLNSFVGSTEKPDAYLMYEKMITREYPDLTREKIRGDVPPSDINLKDTFRQHYGIEERFRKKSVPIESIRRIMEPNYKLHLSSSRGYERDILSKMNLLDGELYNRQTIKPLIV